MKFVEIFGAQSPVEESDNSADSNKSDNSWNTFGNKVKELVAKYAKYNVDNKSIKLGGNLYTSHSGEIEYVESYHSPGGQYRLARMVYHAVKLGSEYPADKATQFTNEYKSLVQKYAPKTVTFVNRKGTEEEHNVQPFNDQGSNFSVYGLITSKKI